MQSFTPLTTSRPFEVYHIRQRQLWSKPQDGILMAYPWETGASVFLWNVQTFYSNKKMYTAINVLVQTLINTKMFIFIIWYLIYPVQKGICAVCNLDTDWECIFDILIESTMMFKSMTDLLNKLPEVSDTDKISDKFEGPDNTGFLEHIIYSFLG